MLLRALVVVFVPFAFLLAPVSGSTLEDATGGFVAYQFDGASRHDAPDSCPRADAQWSATPIGSTDGVLVAPDDVADVFVLDVAEDLRGTRINVELHEATDVENLELTVFVPGCSGTVLELVNWPTPGPTPPAPAEGESQVAAEEVLEPWYCDSAQRMFWVEIYPSYEAGPSIHVAWTDGTSLDVPLAYTHGAAHAVYVTDHALGTTVSGAWVNMPADWTGRFDYVAGPCDAVDGGVVYGDAPESGMGFLEFTPVRSGSFVVQVTYAGQDSDLLPPVPAPVTIDPAPLLPFSPSDLAHDLEHDPVGTVGESLGGLPVASLAVDTDPSDGVRLQPPAPLVMPRSCHTCVGDLEEAVEKISYRLLGSLAA